MITIWISVLTPSYHPDIIWLSVKQKDRLQQCNALVKICMTGGQEMHLKRNEHAGANDRFEDDDNEDPKLDEGNDNN